MVSKQKKLQHLFLRAAFGEHPERIFSLLNTPVESVVEELFTSSAGFKDIEYLPYPLTEDREQKGVTGFQAIKMILKSRQDLEELNAEWLFKMTHTKAALREKMTFFWHNHFATSVPFAYLMQVQNNTIRKYSLGKFGDLLHAMAKDPAMILYLNNQQNSKNHPNENFAREVMELFTLGEGHYTETDIREAARAFTGWTVNGKGEFEFKAKKHDDDEKIFMGRKGNFNGEDILNILLENQQTAKYVVTKIYREFVNSKVNEDRVNELASAFYASGYDISALMKSIFASGWFYDDENIGVKIISPVELIVRYQKLIDIKFRDDKVRINLQRSLGQVLFFPPNVAGWKGGTDWIDSASLLLRLSMPKYIITSADISVKAKPAFEEMNEDAKETSGDGKIIPDWSLFVRAFEKTGNENKTAALLEYLVQCDTGRINMNLVESANSDNPSENIITIAANIMSLPEFQLI